MADKTKIALNLDEIEQKNAKDPFVFVLGGKEITALDPETMDWEDLAELESPGDFVDLCFSPEDSEFIIDQHLPTFKFKRLFEAWQNHYGVRPGRGNRRG